MNQVGTFRHIAGVLRSTQRAAIELENAPEQRKRLRSFSAQEVAALLSVKQRDLRASGKAPIRLAFAEVQALREALQGKVEGIAPVPHRRPSEALATIVFTNFKGGSAKTTSSVHFAQYMALAGYRVLLLDLDSQGSTTAQFGLDPSAEVGRTNSFTAWTAARDTGSPIDAHALCQKTYWPAIDLVPAGAILSEAEESLSQRAASSGAEDTLYFEELRCFLGALGNRYDVAVVDTRPDVNMLMTAALHAATGIVVPTRATMTDLASTGEFFAHIASYVADFNAAFGKGLDFDFARILVTAFDPTDRSQEALVALMRERFGRSVLPGEFLHSRVMGTAGFGKETLYEYDPSTDRTAYNRVLASVNAVNRAIEREVLRAWGRLPAEAAA
ncbi:AAA family ATPase [Belnapia rosea]|uniref:AAA family ATPase n=1 Tax=Belnapia rosea TaxID=938405 RepID=UPI00088B2F9C|nr:AAA family ATPase [Belnapia rosea]SDB73769.1 chromosome partitioning protein [Belnapia rosea]